MSARLVALRLPPGPAFTARLLETWAEGDAVLPLDPRAPVPAPETFDVGGAVPDGTALVIPTSGSTGVPRGVVISHRALEASARASLERLGAAPGERWALRLPVHHVAGILVLVRARLLGSDVVYGDGPAAWTSLVPTQVVRADRSELARYRGILVGGAAPPADLPANATVTYGMTETCGGCVYDGVPLDGVEVRVGDDGRVRIRGPVLADGYRDGSPLALEDGWFVTDDLGRLVDGRLRITGRADDVIITGGENVVATAVAVLLEQHPAVREAAVAGRPDPEWGQRVVAWVVPADRERPPTLEELRRFVAGRTGAASAPRELVLVEAIPRTSLGKVARTELR